VADQLHPIPLVTPGFKGLNTAQASVPDLDAGWAIQCQNFIFDTTGRLAARQGWASLTAARLSFAITFTGAPPAGATGATLTSNWAQASGAGQIVFSDGEYTQAAVINGSTAITWSTPLTGTPTASATFYPAIGAIAELALASGLSYIVSAVNNQLYSGTTSLTNITGSLTITGNNWQFVTFNGAVYGAQAGHPLITWNGTGNFVAAPLAPAKSFTASISPASGSTPTTAFVTAVASGVLGTGDVITSGAAAGTQIVAQLTGITGGVGTYQINLSQTVSSTTMAVAAGVVPSGGSAILAAFGRLWVLNPDNQTISYCALLDATTWNGVGAGSFNLATVWTKGIDAVMAIAAAGSKLVLFGAKQIIIYYDNTNPPIGLNPTNMSVYDTVEGTGCAARDTVQSTGEGDLTFLSPTGVQSLQRLLSSGKDNPVAALDTHIHDYFNSYFLNENPLAVRSAYSPVNRFYVILLPASQRAFCYDTRFKLQGGGTLGELPGALRVTEWPSLTWSSLVNQKSGAILFGENGQIGQYGGYTDNLHAYTLLYTSPNLALANQGDANFENREKILKRMKAVLYFGGNTVVNFQWGTDFAGLVNTYQVTLGGVLSEYGIAQYNVNEYGGGAGIKVVGFPLSNSGRWIQFGMNATINGYVLALQQLDAFCKIGNMV
jgi:hypothetical protein